MNRYTNMSRQERLDEYKFLTVKYEEYKSKNLRLDMSRGKPEPLQLDISMDILNTPLKKSNLKIDDIDVRNYGCFDGISISKKLFSDLLGVSESEIIIGGNSSLNLMHDMVANAMLVPIEDGCLPWGKQGKVKFICPVPGYDRHFAICEKFGIEMINVDMTQTGPDMDVIEKLISQDETIKGIWCVPQYSNPTGVTYSDEIVRRFANLSPKAKDFRIFWDNAYCVHHFYEDNRDHLLNILDECKKTSKEKMVYIFSSTSKISFAGGGVAFVAGCRENMDHIKNLIIIQTIGFDKISQLRHVLFLKDLSNIEKHMEKHAAILRPKFEMVDNVLSEELGNSNLASWTKPLGGYFVSINTLDNCAKRVVSLCRDAEIIFTDAGATFPYKKDPRDRNIRIAPSYPSVHELRIAMELFCLAIKIASMEVMV